MGFSQITLGPKLIAKYSIVFPLGLLITAIALWSMGYSKVHFQNPDAFDYAQMGREIHDDHGFTTQQIFPRHIPILEQQGYLNLDKGH